jgi:hypothetical protein
MVEYQRNGSRNPLRPIRPCELLGVLSAIRTFQRLPELSGLLVTREQHSLVLLGWELVPNLLKHLG